MNIEASWTDVTGAVHDLMAAAALVIGGLFAYLRFVRGRVLHASCGLEIDAKPVLVADASAMRVEATVVNTGTLRLGFPTASQQVITVTAADGPMWEDAVGAGEILWTEGVHRSQELLAIEGVRETMTELEPRERFHRSLLIPLPPGRWVAYRVHMRVEASPKMMWRTGPSSVWETEVVIPEARHDD